MDLGYGNPKASKFATNVGLITSRGKNGDNVMSAEWTYYVSYSPALISVHVGPGKATLENIRETKEFGVNLAASNQNVIASIAGNNSGKEIDKLAVVKEMGADFYPGKKIDCLMLKGAATNAECRVLEEKEVGDHTMFIGEVVEIDSDDTKEPLVYQFGKYHLLGPMLEKPENGVLKKIEELKGKHAKKS